MIDPQEKQKQLEAFDKSLEGKNLEELKAIEQDIIKEAEKIADFLSLIGATSSMLKFEDIRIMRDMRNSVNRIVNCENANFNKVADAANRQIESIKYLDKKIGLNNLPVKLQEIAIARMAHPEVSLKELGELVPGGPISKSGVNHRLRKIMEQAEKMGF